MGDERRLAEARAARAGHGRALVEGVVGALPAWVGRGVVARMPSNRVVDDEVQALIDDAAAAAVEDAGPRLEAAVAAEPGVEYGPGPLQVLRTLVVYPTGVLSACHVDPVRRGEFERRAFPDDVYGLSPATWADVDPDLHELGLAWGAATAHVHLLARSGSRQ